MTFKLPDEKRPVEVKIDEEAFPRMVCPETVRVVAVVVASVVVPVTKVFPETERAVDDAVARVV